MAVWQFSFELVPAKAHDELRRLNAATFADMDAIPRCGGEDVTRFLAKVEQILPRVSSLSELIDIWGDEDDVTVQHWHASHGIKVRVHVGKYGPTSSATLDDLLSAARNQHLVVLLLDDLSLLEAELRPIERAMQESRAMRFIRNPSEYLRGLGKNNPMEEK